ncbi:MAG: hypothetical protein IJS55_07320 [Oscillospiraceae bacterium]|nr:hypothetical protein [Oscillospiraceae bacterium]MBQ7466320.1 hypothetical protein [Oscillospiraceae bacterium]
MPEKITIGNKDGDAQLVAQIVQYQRDHRLTSAAEAVRALCHDALVFQGLIKK